MQHDRGKQRHLDNDDRESEYKRAVRLVEFFGHGVGMTHHAEGAPHHGAEQPEKEQNGERMVRGIGKQSVAEREEHDRREDA
jgi:hypothetical protein